MDSTQTDEDGATLVARLDHIYDAFLATSPLLPRVAWDDATTSCLATDSVMRPVVCAWLLRARRRKHERPSPLDPGDDGARVMSDFLARLAACAAQDAVLACGWAAVRSAEQGRERPVVGAAVVAHMRAVGVRETADSDRFAALTLDEQLSELKSDLESRNKGSENKGDRP